MIPRRAALAAAVAAAAGAVVTAIWLSTMALSTSLGASATEPSGTPSQPGTPRPAAPSPAATGTASATARWQPAVGASWQWQLSGRLDLTVDAEVYDVDAFTTSAEQVAVLHEAGRKVICYVNAGAYEEFRPDHGRYPAELLGEELAGWPGERWLDIRRWDLLEPILAERFAMCRSKGFDAVEPDNMDAYANDSGFPLTAADQLRFNRQIAGLAHDAGLSVGLKNDVEQAAELVDAFDFAVNEECAKYRECAELAVFTSAGKPVFHAEYELPPAAFCPITEPLRLSSIGKRLDLDAARQTCP